MWKALIKLVEKWACRHCWETHHTVEVYEYSYDKMPYKTKRTLICSKCGKIKKIIL